MAKSITEHNFKLTSSSIGFTQELTKVQKQLGLVRNENGLLANSQGQLVQGLSNTKIAMGQWIDQNGKLRDSQGRYIDGLNAAKLAAGQYKDALGNVYNAEGQLIARGKQLMAVRGDISNAFKQTIPMIATASGQVMQLTGMMTQLGGATGQTTKTMFMLSSGMTAFTTVSAVFPTIVKGVVSINTALKTTAGLTALIKGMSGDIVGLVAGGIAAAGVMVMVSQMESAGSTAQTAATRVDTMTSSLTRLWQEAELVGKSTWGLTELSKVVSDISIATDDKILSQLNMVEHNIANREARLKKLEEQKKIIEQRFQFDDSEHLKSKYADIKSQIDKVKNEGDGGLSDTLGRMFAGIIESNKTEREKLRAQITNVEKWVAMGRDADGKAAEALKILEAKAATLTDTYQAEQEAQKVLEATLTGTAKELNEVHKRFRFLTTVTDEEIAASATLTQASEEYAKQLQALTAEGIAAAEVAAEQKRLQEGILSSYESTLDIETRYNDRKSKLTGMFDEAFKQTPQWIAAMKENEKSLLSGSKFGKYLSDARESLVPLTSKLKDMEDEIERVGTELKFSRAEIDKAKQQAKADMAQGKVDKAQDVLVAASRGSVEASRIINQSGDRQTKAIERSEKAIVAGLQSVQRAIESQSTGVPSRLPVFNGGRSG